MGDIIKWPWAPAQVQTPADAATIALTITNTFTIVKVDELAADATINLTIAEGMPEGAILQLRLKSDGTARAVTPGTGMEGTAVAGVINKTKVATYVYDGSKYVHTATEQID